MNLLRSLGLFFWWRWVGRREADKETMRGKHLSQKAPWPKEAELEKTGKERWAIWKRGPASKALSATQKPHKRV